MTKPEIAKLLKQIARLAERAYRRGFHHGYTVGTGPRPPAADLVEGWRVAPSIYHTTGAPGTERQSKKVLLVPRLATHVNEADHPDIVAMLKAIGGAQEAKPEPEKDDLTAQ